MHRHSRPQFVLLFLCLGSLFSITMPKSWAHEVDSLKVGLVLSGGGAKGMAHVGALQILDSLGIPIHFVGGTSMGAIVGGLYSIGYSADMIAEEIKQTNWEDLLSDKPKREELSIFLKKKSDRYFLNLDIEENQIQIPGGVNNGHKILNYLSRLTQSHHNKQSFNSFQRPFLLTTTDLEKGKSVIMQEGILPWALRASMAIPSVFTPFEIDSTIHIDGGVINNLPAEEVEKMGADILICIDVQTADLKNIDNLNAADLMERVGMLVNLTSSEERRSHCDILIRPYLSDMNVFSFSKAEKLLERGREATRKMIPEILALTKQATPHPVNPISQQVAIQIEEIEIYGVNNTTQTFIHSILGDIEHSRVNLNRLEEKISSLYASGLYNSIHYLSPKIDSNSYKLEIHVEESSSSGLASFGIHYDSDFKTVAEVGVSSENLFLSGSRTYLRIGISENPRFFGSFSASPGEYPGIGLDIRSNTFRPPIFDGKSRLGRFTYTDAELSLYSFYNFINLAQFRIGFSYASFFYNFRRASYLEGEDLDGLAPQLYHDPTTSVFFSAYNDQLDDLYFPTKGRKIEGGGRMIFPVSRGPGVPTFVFHLNSRFVHEIRKNLILEYNLNSSIQLGPQATYGYGIHAGGVGYNYENYFERFYGYAWGQLRELSNFQNVKLSIRWHLGNDHYISSTWNYGLELHTIQWSDINHFGGYGFNYTYRSRLGPLGIDMHRSTERGDWIAYVSLGYWL